MRQAIYQELINEITEIDGRCFEPHAAERSTPKPYLVIRQGVDAEDTPWMGFRRVIEVWPYVSRTTFKSVDSLVQKVVNALEDQLLTDPDTGDVFTCKFLGSIGTDVVDEEWDAITRGLRFAVIALQAVNVPETAANDPWIEALGVWTETLMGDSWTIYRNLWPMGFKKPSILWRITTDESRDVSRAVYERKVGFVGHVLCSTKGEQIIESSRIPLKLISEIKIPLDPVNRRYLTVVEAKGDMSKDALTSGQIFIRLKAKVMRTFDQAPYMQKVVPSGNLQ